MTRRGLGYALLAAAPALVLLALAWPWTSGAPEPAAWRTYAREAPLPFAGGAWAGCAGGPNFVAFLGPYRALLSAGADFPTLAHASWLLAACCLVLMVPLLGRVGPATVLLSLLVFSPAFGANWLLVERARLFLPALCACAMVLLLRPPASRARFLLVLALAVLAVFTHAGGSLLWAAALPLAVVAVRRAGWPTLPAVATLLLAGNLAMLVCYDESSGDAPGLVAAAVQAPAATLGFLGHLLGLALPDVLPGTGADTRCLGALLVAALLLGALAAGRADAARQTAALPWLCLGLAGLAQGLALAHAQVPQAVVDSVLRELAWGTWLLPVGVIGLWAQLAPRYLARLAPAGGAALLVLLVQDWHRGVDWLHAEARLLRHNEALLVFAELGGRELPATARGAIPPPADRAALRAAGLLRHAAPVADHTLSGLARRSATAPVGHVLAVTPSAVNGGLLRAAGNVDLVLVMRQRGAEPPVLCKVALPDAFGAGAVLAWQAEFGEVEPFVAGDVVFALAFDLCGRALLPVQGRFRFDGSQFSAIEVSG